jgi:hypothetical protein
MIKNHLTIILLLVLLGIGCATSFQNWVNVSLNARDNVRSELYSIVETIAKKYDLDKDISNSTPGKKISYFGRPYHYYIFELEESKDGTITVRFIHEARMSTHSNKRSEPENEFLEAIKRTYNSDILEIEHHFIE